MPPRKEPKETVVYPASKRKAPPFKPQRPSKVPRIPTTDSESTQPKRTKPTIPARRQNVIQIEDEDDEDGADSASAGAEKSDSDEELDDDPLAPKVKPTKPKKPPLKSAQPKRKPSREVSPMSISSQQSSNPSPDRPRAVPDPPLLHPPSQSEDGDPIIPQPLLVRLLHEHFADKKTKIDKHAIQVLQKYFEVFIREAIARAKLQKAEEAEKAGTASEVDASWLEMQDLDKVAAGMFLDF